ncbi:MAG: cytochrome c maturation protein CcmE [Myxococcota bacterium]|jgi:cytochrome c-type biogenesis protein CcmE|nr:cytochrome c maturation protein CcmE [Myxococcota bacterium]
MNRKKTLPAIASAVLVIGAVAYLMFTSFGESMVYYKTVDELLAERARFEGKPVRINGVLSRGSLRHDASTDEYRFTMTKQGQALEISYRGVLPDSMQDSQELVVHGVLEKSSNLFVASEILTKCPSKYEAQAQAKGP